MALYNGVHKECLFRFIGGQKSPPWLKGPLCKSLPYFVFLVCHSFYFYFLLVLSCICPFPIIVLTVWYWSILFFLQVQSWKITYLLNLYGIQTDHVVSIFCWLVTTLIFSWDTFFGLGSGICSYHIQIWRSADKETVTDNFACSIAILCMKQWHAVVFPFSLTSIVYAGSMVLKCLLLLDSWIEDGSQGIPFNCVHNVFRKIYCGSISVASNIGAWRNLVVVSFSVLFSICYTCSSRSSFSCLILV